MKFFNSSSARFIFVGILVVILLFSLGIWIPQLESIIKLENDPDLVFYLGGWQNLLIRSFEMGEIKLGISILFIPIIITIGGFLTLSFIIPITISSIKGFEKSKRYFIVTFIFLFVVLVFSCIQISNPKETIILYLNPSPTIALSLIVILSLVGYIVIFFLINKIRLEESKINVLSENKEDINSISKDTKSESNSSQLPRIPTPQIVTQNLEIIQKLKILLDSGALSQSEFEREKIKILDAYLNE